MGRDMNILYKHGDLMKAVEPFIVHGCNAQGVMGSGVAKLIRDRYPQAYEEYNAAYREQGNHLFLGQTIWVNTAPHAIINAVTQDRYGRDENVVYADYDGIRKAFQSINEAAVLGKPGFDEVTAVALPLIGAGLANGRWSIISEIIETEATKFQPVVYLVDGIIPDGIVPAEGCFVSSSNI